MGFWSSLKQIFSLSGEDDTELKRLREKHGTSLHEKEKYLHEDKNDPGTPDYDPWEEIKNIRMNFFFGSWVTRKVKFRPVGEEKVKKQLEELAKKREEEEAKKRGEGKIE
jgi:hypothetical protein